MREGNHEAYAGAASAWRCGSCAILALLLLAPAPARGQDAPSAALDDAGRHQISLWAGGSWHSMPLITGLPGTRLGLLSIRYARTIDAGTTRVWRYVAEGLPFAVITYPGLGRYRPRATPPGLVIEEPHQPAYGVGLAPVGFQVSFRPRRRVQPFLSTSGGVAYFSRPVPDLRGKRLNFTFDAGAGVQVVTGRRTALLLGYRLHHLSNGFRGQINPGLNSNVLYLGVTVSAGRPASQ